MTLFRKSVCYQMKMALLSKGFWAVCIINTLFGILSFAHQCFISSGKDIMYAVDANAAFCLSAYTDWNFIEPLYPFLLPLSFAITVVLQRKSGSISYLELHSSPQIVYLSELIVGFVSSFIVFFFPFLLNNVICNFFLPHNGNVQFGIMGMPSYTEALTGENLIISVPEKPLPFLHIYLANPFLYNMVYVLLFAVFSAIMGLWLTAFSLFIKQHIILLFFPPFVLFTLQESLTQVSYQRALSDKNLICFNYSLLDYCVPFSFLGKDFTYFTLSCCAIVACSALMALIAFYIHQKTVK